MTTSHVPNQRLAETEPTLFKSDEWKDVAPDKRRLSNGNGIAFDSLPRFVEIIAKRPNGIVEFVFSIGWKDLSVELMMPEAAFSEFCVKQNVQMLN